MFFVPRAWVGEGRYRWLTLSGSRAERTSLGVLTHTWETGDGVPPARTVRVASRGGSLH